MALVSIGGYMMWPEPTIKLAGTNLAYASALLDASGEIASFVLQIPTTGNITKIGFATGTVTTGDTMKVGIYAVSATTGDPDTATAYGGMVAGTVVIADTDDNTWKLCTLGTQCSATAGDLVAVVIEFNSYVAGNLNITRNAIATLGNHIPYSNNFQGGAWGKSSGWPNVTLEYGGTYYSIPGVIPSSAISARAYNTGAANDEGGNLITPPFKCRASGIWYYGGLVGGATVKLYDTDGTTVMASKALDKDQQTATTNGLHQALFATPQTLSAGGAYRITILAAGASSEVLYDFTVDSAAAMGAWPGGTSIVYTTQDGGGGWSQTDTRRALIGLLIDQLDDGAGTGGGINIMLE